MRFQLTKSLTEAEWAVYYELLADESVTREDLIGYILETVHVGEDTLDSVTNALLC